VPKNADHFTLRVGRTDITQCFEQRERFNFLAEQAGCAVEQGLLETLHGAQAAFLGEVVDLDDGHFGLTTKALRKDIEKPGVEKAIYC
jgi:hypothetical protein